MDKDDLVKRLRVELRRASPVHHYLVESELAGEAADRIEALEAENARLKTALACAGGDIAEVAHNAEVSEMARVDLCRIVSDIGNHVRLSEITRLEAALGEKP